MFSARQVILVAAVMALAGLAFELVRRRTGALEFSAETTPAQSSAQVQPAATGIPAPHLHFADGANQ